MLWPVRGLRPVVAERLETAKVPKPTRRTSSPDFNAEEIEDTNASTALAASVLVKPLIISYKPMSTAEPLFTRKFKPEF